jgi:hypothetical protein
MQYLLLIYHNEAEWAKLTPAQAEPVYMQYRALREDLQKKGQYLGGSQLRPTATATTVRVRNGKRISTDGPFAETKEQLGGFFLVDAGDLDEALAIAAKIPAANDGSIEVRPLAAQGQAAPA